MSGRNAKRMRRDQQESAIAANSVANQVLRVLNGQIPENGANGLAWAAAHFCDQTGIDRKLLTDLISKVPRFNPRINPPGKA